MQELLFSLNEELATLVAGVLPSLVQVRRGGRSLGAGTVWHADGLVLTNAHVVADRPGSVDPLQIVLADGRALPARVLALDTGRDLAALSVPASQLPAIPLGDSQALRPGDWVVAVGHPWGVTGAATAGAVITIGPPAEHGLRGTYIQVGLQLRPGHSGGAMVDVRGQLVGINTMINGPEVGLAVPVHEAGRFLKDKLGSEPLSGATARPL